MFCLVTSSLGHLQSQFSIVFEKEAHGVCGGVEEIGLGFPKWSVAGSEARDKDRVRSVASGHAIL